MLVAVTSQKEVRLTGNVTKKQMPKMSLYPGTAAELKRQTRFLNFILLIGISRNLLLQLGVHFIYISSAI